MSEKSPFSAFFNPAAGFAVWEKFATEQLDRCLKNETLLGLSGGWMKAAFKSKAQVDRFLDQGLRAMRVPSAGDLDAVFARLTELDRRLDDLAEAIERLERR